MEVKAEYYVDKEDSSCLFHTLENYCQYFGIKFEMDIYTTSYNPDKRVIELKYDTDDIQRFINTNNERSTLKFGRKTIDLPNKESLKDAIERGYTKVELAEKLGVSRQTIYNRLKQKD